jgi:hypothetical protein
MNTAYKKPNLKKMQAECDAFNAENPVGAKVTVKLDGRDDLFETVTRSEAQILSGHSVVIWLENVSGCYLLDRVTPVFQFELEAKTITMLVLTGMNRLDPIRVMTEDYEPGKGRITITCYGRAWTAYWGGMSGKTVSQFFTSCDACYLLGNLSNGLKNTKAEDAYLIRIIEAVQAGLRKQAAVVAA